MREEETLQSTGLGTNEYKNAFVGQKSAEVEWNDFVGEGRFELCPERVDWRQVLIFENEHAA